MKHRGRDRTRVNRAIRAPKVLVIGTNSEQLGVMSPLRALKIAEDVSLDLVEIAPKADPPVCRIMDYGKYKYEQGKREREERKKQKVYELKEMRFRPSIEEHDFGVKVDHLRKFLELGHKTKVTVRFRRMELAHKERGTAIMMKAAKELQDLGKIIRPSTMEGNCMSMILAPLETKGKK